MQTLGQHQKSETIYFKDSGEPIKIKAEINKVIQFADLNPKKAKKILNKYGKDDGIEKAKNLNFLKGLKIKSIVF